MTPGIWNWACCCGGTAGTRVGVYCISWRTDVGMIGLTTDAPRGMELHTYFTNLASTYPDDITFETINGIIDYEDETWMTSGVPDYYVKGAADLLRWNRIFMSHPQYTKPGHTCGLFDVEVEALQSWLSASGDNVLIICDGQDASIYSNSNDLCHNALLDALGTSIRHRIANDSPTYYDKGYDRTRLCPVDPVFSSFVTGVTALWDHNTYSFADTRGGVAIAGIHQSVGPDEPTALIMETRTTYGKLILCGTSRIFEWTYYGAAYDPTPQYNVKFAYNLCTLSGGL